MKPDRPRARLAQRQAQLVDQLVRETGAPGGRDDDETGGADV
jgi:hypothetical protein